MAKKTTVVTTEEDITPTDPSPTQEHDEGVLAALEGKDDVLTLDSEKLDEPAQEPKEEPKEEPKVEEPEPLDKETLKKELKDEVIKEIEVLKKDQTAEEKDEYDKFVEEYTDKNGKAPEWKQVASFLKDQAKSEIKAELQAEVEEEEKKEEETKVAQEAQQQELNDNLNKNWDKQLEDLTKRGLLPTVKDPNNNEVTIIKDAEGKEIERVPQEEGKKARYELFKAMYLASEESMKNGEGPITNLKEVFYEHYKKDKQPAGADAPISGVRKSVSQDSGNTFKYTDVHNTPMEDLLKQAQ